MANPQRSDGGRSEYESGAQSETTSSSGASETTERAKAQASEVAEQAKEQASRLSDRARDQISTRAEQQKERATDRLQDIGSALHETSGSLRDRDQDAAARLVEGMADRVEHFAGYLREHSVDDMMNQAERFARREPELFLGGAMLLGLMGARFLKSSSSERYGEPYRGRAGERSYRARGPARREERRRPTVAGTSGAEMPDPSRVETSVRSEETSGTTRPGGAS
mgnify:CR=1 FL=1